MGKIIHELDGFKWEFVPKKETESFSCVECALWSEFHHRCMAKYVRMQDRLCDSTLGICKEIGREKIMTNAEIYKTPEEQTKAFAAFCRARSCLNCEHYKPYTNIKCTFAWLASEGKMPAAEVADILEEHNKWQRGVGVCAPHIPKKLIAAIDRAVELLRKK